MEPQPLVSIVTPALNAERFIRQTIESVLTQDYPNIEYLVMDGGSTDGTVEIVKRYQDRLRYFSERDGGAADAINRGFVRSSGAIFAWLSADDTYLPGAVGAAVRRFVAEPDAAVVYGQAHWTDENGKVLGEYPRSAACDDSALAKECCICQPACFLRRSAFEQAGMLDVKLHSAFDYDLWIRLSRKHRFRPVDEFLATSRMHRSNKSLGARGLMFDESIGLLRRHYGYVPVNWIYGYLSFRRDGRDQFFEPLRRSAWLYLLSLPVGAYYNPAHVLRYGKEWLSRLLRGIRA